MRFASLRIAEEFNSAINSGLRGLLEEIEDIGKSLYQWEPLVTCLIRTPKENDSCYYNDGTHLDGVHVHGRGADIRTRDVDPEAVSGIVNFVNEKYIYDTERPHMKVALFERYGKGSTGAHLHVQIHPNTQNRHIAKED